MQFNRRRKNLEFEKKDIVLIIDDEEDNISIQNFINLKFEDSIKLS